MWETRFSFWVGKIPWKREWQPTLVFLPGELHRQKNLVSYSQWSQLDLTFSLDSTVY